MAYVLSKSIYYYLLLSVNFFKPNKSTVAHKNVSNLVIMLWLGKDSLV